ncbi:MAG: hypothetical protein K2N56_01600, partial [Oscillospiraceae bacterium]|nr:hypothetical protein [Oscillospiraceae bacterium]
MKIPVIFSKKEQSAENSRREYYKKRCSELTEQLNDIRTNYDFVSDPQSIDALIFAENSVTCQLELLYREARAEGITIQLHERMK